LREIIKVREGDKEKKLAKKVVRRKMALKVRGSSRP